jgi:hypothetical protein
MRQEKPNFLSKDLEKKKGAFSPKETQNPIRR